jgi:hypothetical protein
MGIVPSSVTAIIMEDQICKSQVKLYIDDENNVERRRRGIEFAEP